MASRTSFFMHAAPGVAIIFHPSRLMSNTNNSTDESPKENRFQDRFTREAPLFMQGTLNGQASLYCNKTNHHAQQEKPTEPHRDEEGSPVDLQTSKSTLAERVARLVPKWNNTVVTTNNRPQRTPQEAAADAELCVFAATWL